MSGRVRGLLLPAVIVLLGAGYYLPHILASQGFTGDDFYLLTVASDSSLSWLTVFGADVPYFIPFRPLTMLSFHLQYVLGGDAVQAYLMVNLCCFLGTAVLLYVIILQLQQDFLNRQSTMLSFILSLLFLAHTGMFYHAMWTSQRTETLMMFFYAAALLTALRHLRRPSPWTMGAVVLLYVLSLLAKSTGLHFPLIFIVLALLYARSGHGPSQRDISAVFLRSLPLLLVMGGYVVVRALLDPSAGGFPLEWLIKKPFTFLGVTMASIHPDLAVVLYRYAGYDVLPAAVVTAVFLLTAAFLLYSVRHYRGWLSLAFLVYAITFLPRIFARADDRVNSLQIMVLLIITGVVLLHVHGKPRTFGLLLFIFIHVGTGLPAMQEWNAAVDSERRLLAPYARALESGELEGVTAVFSHIVTQRSMPYRMHYLRHGRFGTDISAMASGVGFAPKPFSRTSAPRVEVGDAIHAQGDGASAHEDAIRARGDGASAHEDAIRARGDGDAVMFAWTQDHRMEFASIEPPVKDSTVFPVEAHHHRSAAASLTLRVSSTRDRWAYLVILPDTVIAVK